MNRKGQMPVRFLVAFVFALSIFFAAGAQAGWIEIPGENVNPAIAFDAAANDWVVGWRHMVTYPHARIYASRVAELGSALDPGGIVLSDGSNQAFSAHSASSPNRTLVVWYEGGLVFGRILENGSPIGDAFQVSEVGIGGELRIDVAWGNGSFLVVFQDDSYSTGYNIVGQMVDEDGTLVGSTITIAQGVSSNPVMRPAVASNGSNWLVAYEYNTGLSNVQICIASRVVGFDGTVEGDNSCVSPGISGRPSLATAGSGYLLSFCWNDFDPVDGWRPVYMTQSVGSDGVPQGGANVLWSDPFSWKTYNEPKIACGSANCLITVGHFESFDGGRDIVGQFTDLTGVPNGDRFNIAVFSDGPSGVYSWSHAFSAFDPSTDRVLVVWSEGSYLESVVNGAVYTAPDTEITPTFPISADCNGCFVDGVCYDEAAACDDGLYCTATDTCTSGVCSGADSPCPEGWFCSELSNQCFADEETPIDLITFEADAEDTTVLLTWETATERDMAGFHLLRSRVDNGGYERVTSSLIPSEGDAFTGASYEFTDESVDEGTYYYKLEAIDLTGASEFFGPVEATVEAEPEFGCGMADSRMNAVMLVVMAAIGMLIWSRRRYPQT